MLKDKIKEKEVTYKTKTLHYRRATFVNYNDVYNLQELLQRALHVTPKVGDRYLEVLTDNTDSPDKDDDAPKSKLFLNHHVVMWGIQFSDLLKYSDDTNANVVTVDHSAEFLDIEQMAPSETADGKKREFLDSVMYIAAFKNHLAIIQSATLRTGELERYLNWFLKKTGVMSEGHILLSPQATSHIQKQLEKSDIKSIKIGTPLVETIDNEPIESYKEIKSIDTKSIKVTPKGRGLDMLLSAFGGDISLLKDFGINPDDIANDAIEGSDIQVSLELTYKRHATKKSKQILNDVSKAMRHAHPDDITLDIENVGKLKGSALNIRKNLTIKYYNGILDPEDLYLKIQTWMTEQIELDEIEAEV